MAYHESAAQGLVVQGSKGLCPSGTDDCTEMHHHFYSVNYLVGACIFKFRVYVQGIVFRVQLPEFISWYITTLRPTCVSLNLLFKVSRPPSSQLWDGNDRSNMLFSKVLGGNRTQRVCGTMPASQEHTPDT